MKNGYETEEGKGVKRISISLPPEVYSGLNQVIGDGKFSNRSQAISEMIHRGLLDLKLEYDDEVALGVITLFFDQSKRGLVQKITEIQRSYNEEMLGCQSIFLENDMMMQVIFCQASASKLKQFLDQLIICKGVRSGRLELSSALVSPLVTRGSEEDNQRAA